MAKVAIAACADDFGADHTVAGVVSFANVRLGIGFKKTWPAGAGCELGIGVEQRQAAQAAGVDSEVLVVQPFAAERGFCAVLQEDAAFFGVECGNQCLTL